jgi:AcrR family transcriptional regulator
MAVKRQRGRPPVTAAHDARAALLDAAAEVFATHGFSGASVDRILRAAGFSKGTFYWHFASKEELFLALVEERIDRPARALMDVTRTAPADAPTAPAVSRRLAELFTGQRQLLVLLQEYWAAAVRDPAIRRRYRRRQRDLVSNLADALRARHDETGVPLTTRAERLATAFVALAQGLALEAAVNPDAVDASLYGDILSLVYDGLAARR